MSKEEIARITGTLIRIFSAIGDPWELAERNSVLPWLYDQTPNPAYRRKYEIAVSQSLCQMQELDACETAFREAGIPLIPLKGSLMKRLYPSPHLRPMFDLDFLYRTSDGPVALSLMEKLGFAVKSTDEYNHDEFVKPPFLTVELHRSLIPAIFTGSDYFERVWERVTEIRPGEWTLSPEEQYLFIVAHFAKHMTECGGAGIRSLLDLYFWEKEWGDRMDRSYLTAALEQMGLTAFEKRYREMAINIFSADDPDLTSYRKDLRFMVLCGTYGLTQVSTHRRMQKDGGSRLGYAWRRLFPSFSRMCVLFPPLREHPLRLPFYYLRRMWRAITTQRKALSAELEVLRGTPSASKEGSTGQQEKD